MEGVWIPKAPLGAELPRTRSILAGLHLSKKPPSKYPLRFGGHLFQKQMLPELTQTLNQKCTSQKPVAFP